MPTRPLPRDLKKALGLIEAQPAHAWSLRELAAACRTTPRTLQRHFRAGLGCAPVEALRERRLAAVRRDLLRGAGASVTEIATRHGFRHLGRFSLCYRERFGETPSRTLCRARSVEALARRPHGATARPAIALPPIACGRDDVATARLLRARLSEALRARGWRIVGEPDGARYELSARLVDDGAASRLLSLRLQGLPERRGLWAGLHAFACGEPYEVGEFLAAGVASALEAPLRAAEIARATAADPDWLDGWALAMRALPCALSFDPRREARALALLERAMQASPGEALPAALASWCHGLLAGHHFAPDAHGERAAARTLAVRAARLSGDDALAEVFVAAGFTLAHDLPAAARHADRALRIDGGSAWAWGRSGWVRAYRGEAAEAIERFRIARELAPGDALAFLWAIGIGSARLESGRYEDAARWYARALAERPSAGWNDRFRAAALALAGHAGPARRVLARFRRAFPGVTIAAVRTGLPHTAGFLDRVCEGLESAGLPP